MSFTAPTSCAGRDVSARALPRPERILAAFRAGVDTYDIAAELGIAEATVLAELTAARSADRGFGPDPSRRPPQHRTRTHLNPLLNEPFKGG